MDENGPCKAVELESPTTISFEVYLIPDARIPSVSVPDTAPKIPTGAEFRDLEVAGEKLVVMWEIQLFACKSIVYTYFFL